MITGSLWASYFFCIVSLLTVDILVLNGVLDVKAVVTVVVLVVAVMVATGVLVVEIIVAKRVLLQMVVAHALKVDVAKIVMVTVGRTDVKVNVATARAIVYPVVLVPPVQESLVLFFKTLIKRIKIDINMTKLQVLGELL